MPDHYPLSVEEFCERFKRLRFIDRADFDLALGPLASESRWVSFRGDPAGFLLRADDDLRARIWAETERKPRCMLPRR